MVHLKKDFKYHKKFDNKYVNLTYFTYLYLDKTRHIPRGSDDLPYSIIHVLNCIILCNNKISQRGSMQSHIEDIKKYLKNICNRQFSLYTRYYVDTNCYDKNHNYDSQNHYYKDGEFSSKATGNLEEVSKLLRNARHKNKYYLYVADIIDKILYWNDNIDNDFEGFKDFIYDTLKDFDNNHYDWIVGENILYDRSIKDNVLKRVYCIANNDVGSNKFIQAYSDMVLIDKGKEDLLYEQVISYLLTLGDINNLFTKKDFKGAKELLNDFCDDDIGYKKCLDIYYRKSFEKLNDIRVEYNKNNNSTIAFKKVQELIEKENKKYSDYFILFELVAIDLENNEYTNVVPLP